jgi:hypothetical protein
MRTISEQDVGRTGVDSGWFSRIRGVTKVLGGILFFALLHNPVQAVQSVTLAWGSSLDTGVAGYNMYYGAASLTYTSMVDLGSTTNGTISGLVEGATYYFAVKAYDPLGLESDYSNEAVYTVPGIIPGAPAQLQLRVAPVGQFILTVTGQVGSTYNIQASPDLSAWTVIGSVMVPAGGSLDFTDTNAASFPQRFYRTQ